MQLTRGSSSTFSVKRIRKAAIIFVSVFVLTTVMPINLASGEMVATLALKGVMAVQAPFSQDVLAEGKATLLRIQVDFGIASGYYIPLPFKFQIKIEYDSMVVYQDPNTLGRTVLFGGAVSPRTETFDVAIEEEGMNEFYLPPKGSFIWPKGSLKVTVTLDPNNDPSLRQVWIISKTATVTYPVKDTKPFRILFVPAALGEGETEPTNQEVWDFARDAFSYLVGTFPISELESSYQVDCSSVVRTTRELDMAIELAKRADMAQPPFDHAMGVVRRNRLNGGFAYASRRASVVDAGLGAAATPAHEVAHSFPFEWVTPGHPLEDPSNPRHAKSSVVAEGYWVERRTHSFFLTSPPQITRDIMAYWATRWISVYTFNHLLSKLKTNPSDPKVILISGTVSKYGTMTLEPWYKLDSDLDISLNNPGAFRILYLDKQGDKIGETGFDPSFWICDLPPPGQELNVTSFALRIPDLEGTEKIVIQQIIADGISQTLAERVISPNPPNVEVTSLEMTERTIHMRWSASDPDDDALTYTVLYSPDRGRTWIPLALDLTDKEFRFEAPANLESLSIKVTVTDGINTVVDIATAFGQPPPPPANIYSSDYMSHPKDVFEPGETVYVTVPATGQTVTLYVVTDKTAWNNSDILTDVSDGTETLTLNFGPINETIQIWAPPLKGGTYDIVMDANNNGIFDSGIDAVDSIFIPGFNVIPEIPFGTTMSFLSMFIALIIFLRFKRLRPRFRPQ